MSGWGGRRSAQLPPIRGRRESWQSYVLSPRRRRVLAVFEVAERRVVVPVYVRTRDLLRVDRPRLGRDEPLATESLRFFVLPDAVRFGIAPGRG